MGRRILGRIAAVMMAVMVWLFGTAFAEQKGEGNNYTWESEEFVNLDLEKLKAENSDKQKYLIPWDKMHDGSRRYLCDVQVFDNRKNYGFPNNTHMICRFSVYWQQLGENAPANARDTRHPLYRGRFDWIFSDLPDTKIITFYPIQKTLHDKGDWEAFLATWKKNWENNLLSKEQNIYKDFLTASGQKVVLHETRTKDNGRAGTECIMLVETPYSPDKYVLKFTLVTTSAGFNASDVAKYESDKARMERYLANLSIKFSDPIILEIFPDNLKAEAGGDKDAVTVTTHAPGTPGEDGGVAIPIAIVIGSAAAAAAIGAAAGSGKDEGKKQSSFRLYVFKNFGDTLQVGEKPQPIYARIAELTPEGAEIPRADMSSQINISSGTPGLEVWDGGMVNGYRGAELSIPDKSFAETECIVSFKFTGEGGTLTENMIFKVMGEAKINFGQENLTLPARYDKAVRLPFGIPNFGDISQATVTAEITPEGGYTVTLESDLKYPGVFYANITETIKDEKEPGEIDIYYLKVKASRTDLATGEEKTLSEELPLYRMHMGLILDIDGINCCGFLKEEAKGKKITNIKKEDFECGTTEAHIKLLTWDEETNSVFTMAPIPIEGSFRVSPKEEGDEALKKIIDSELKLEMVPVEAGMKGTKCVIVGHAVLDPPARYAAVLSLTLKWTRRDGKEEIIPFKKEITLRSQPLLKLKDADKEKCLKETREFSELLDHIITRIDALNLHERLFSLYNLARVMRKGYDPDYGYDPYQMAKVKYIWGNFNKGRFIGTNADPDVLPPTLADQAWMWTLSTLEMGEVVEEKLGFMGRMVLGYYTAGLSESAFLALKSARNMIAYAEDDAIADSEKTALGMFRVGVKPVAIQFLLQNAIELGVRRIGGSGGSLADEAKILLKGEMGGKGVGEIIGERLAATGKFFNPRTMGTRMKNAVETTRSALQAAKDKGKLLIEKFKGGAKTPAEDLAETVHKKAAKEGEELVRKLEQMAAGNKDIVQKIKEKAGQAGDLPAGAGEYLELGELGEQITRRLDMENLILEIQSNKSAMRFLKNWKGANANEVRAVFNNGMLNFYDDIGEAWLTEISAATGCARSSLSIVNKSSTGLQKLRDGLTTTFDKDWTPQIVDSNGKLVNVDLEVATRSFRKILYMRGHGGKFPPSDEAAAAYARLLDQTVVSDGHAEMYGKADDVDKAINPARQGEKFTDPEGVARAAAFKGADRFREASEYTEKAMKLSDEAMKAANVDPAKAAEMMKKSIELMKNSAREGQEGLRQMTKQFNNIIVPRNEIAKGLGRADAIPQRIYDMMDVVRRCSDTGEIPYEAVKGILKEDFGVTMEEFANEVGELLKKIDIG